MDNSRLGAAAQYGQYSRASAQPVGKHTGDQQTASSGSLFDEYLNARKPISNTSVVDVGYEHGSPLCQLFDDYRVWKQDKQDIAMPDVDSSLDEKLTYVREH